MTDICPAGDRLAWVEDASCTADEVSDTTMLGHAQLPVTKKTVNTSPSFTF